MLPPSRQTQAVESIARGETTIAAAAAGFQGDPTGAMEFRRQLFDRFPEGPPQPQKREER